MLSEKTSILGKKQQKNVHFAGLFFLICVASYVAAGLVSLFWPPQSTNKIGSIRIPKDAQCARVTRGADYTTVHYPLGTPFRTIEMLLRLDLVDDLMPKVFSKLILESSTVHCNATACSDVTLLRDGPRGNQLTHVNNFEYFSATDAVTRAYDALSLGLGGELTLSRDTTYYLTADQLCFHADAIDDGTTLQITANHHEVEMADLEEFDDTPVARAHSTGTCELDAAKVFPAAASLESSWLHFVSSSERAHEQNTRDRRSVIEVGTDCAKNDTALVRAYGLLEIDCAAAGATCLTDPSIPYRHVADKQIVLSVGQTTSILVLENDVRLEGIPTLNDSSSAITLSVIKLILMILVAAIVWVRSSKSTAEHDRLVTFCMKSTYCAVKDEVKKHHVLEDAFIGFIAIVARIAVATWRFQILSADNQSRAVVSQIIAGGFSLIHWIFRYFVLKRKVETPLTKLGGSTALCDAPAAVFIAFMAPPTLTTNTGRFEPTARLLTSLLLSTVSAQRCIFAAACCGMLFTSAIRDKLDKTDYYDSSYKYYVGFAGVSWFVQSASVAILLADGFATPMAFSTSRSLPGHVNAVKFAIFAIITAAALPPLTRTLDRLQNASLKCE